MKNVKLEKLKNEIIPLMARIAELETNNAFGQHISASYQELAEKKFELATAIQRLDALTRLYERLMNADLQ